MQFYIMRSSSYLDDDKQPCEGAVQVDVERVVCHKVTEKDKEYYENATYYTENGVEMVRRSYIDKAWTIEINSLEELLDFQKKCGCSLILSGDSIEIYDDYRE